MGNIRYFKRKHKRSLIEILLSAVLFVGCVILVEGGVLPAHPLWRVAAFLLPYLPVAWRVLWKAVRGIAHGQVFDENFLMSLATVGAFCVGEYAEAVFVMLFYRVGELFEELAVGKSRASIASLMAIRPDTAHVEREGAVVTVDPAEVAAGEIILIRPGERVPLDGVLIEGSTTLDTSALTGESLPREAEVGDDVVSGCVNQSGVVRVRVSRVYAASTVARILELTESASAHKSQSEHFITRFARIYTPLVVLSAALLAVLPPLCLGRTSWAVWREWVERALSFLVISCPCALVISVPLSFFGGIGGASRRGILIKGSAYIEALAACDTVVFDKTGTLTEGRFSVRSVTPARGFGVDELLFSAAAAEQDSTHPLARALVAASPRPLTESDREAGSVEETAGHGVTARVRVQPSDGGVPVWRKVTVGNARLLAAAGVTLPETIADTADAEGTTVYVAVDGRYAGRMVITDTIRPEAATTLADLSRCGVTRTVMLTGDGAATAASVAAAVGVDEYHAGLLPADKVARLEEILAERSKTSKSKRGKGSRTFGRGAVAMVGDGINDAPVLARADIGIAMGGMGSDAAIEAADVVLMDDRMSALPVAIRLSRKTLRIVRQNIAFALSVKAVVLILGACGLAGLPLAVFADVGVAVLAILNAMRAMR